MIDCRQCKYGQTVRHKDRLCDQTPLKEPIEQARDKTGECGPAAVHFTLKKEVP